MRGMRSRVVNGKRTSLPELLLKRCEAQRAWSTSPGSCLGGDAADGFYQGHTRFATSSVSNLAGCHPHQWLPRTTQMHWSFVGSQYVGDRKCVEGFITVSAHAGRGPQRASRGALVRAG